MSSQSTWSCQGRESLPRRSHTPTQLQTETNAKNKQYTNCEQKTDAPASRQCRLQWRMLILGRAHVSPYDTSQTYVEDVCWKTEEETQRHKGLRPSSFCDVSWCRSQLASLRPFEVVSFRHQRPLPGCPRDAIDIPPQDHRFLAGANHAAGLAAQADEGALGQSRARYAHPSTTARSIVLALALA